MNRKLISIMGVACAIQAVGAQTLDTETIATGLGTPLQVTFAPGDPDRIFFVERVGRISFQRAGEPRETFLDITDVVTMDGEFDEGLLSAAFDPNYETNGKFYVFFTREQDGRDPIVIASYTVSSDPDRADPNSGVQVIEIERINPRHPGGWIEFGPNDGMLYFTVGENARPENAQLLTNLLGKIIRVDPNADDFPDDDLRNYAIPPDNPFVNEPGARPEIWAYGLRSPWRAAFDEATGDLYLGDVGAMSYEELDFQPGTSPGGENYGWECYEGSHERGVCLDLPPNPTFPIFEFTHEDGRCAIIGGRVYRGCAIPELQGSYFFADLCTQTFWSLRYDGSQITELIDRSSELRTQGRVTSFGVDYYGELYICILGGPVRKIVPVIPPPDSDGDGIPDSCEGCGGADIDMDGDIDAEDFFAYLDAFAAGNFGVCDIDNDGDCDAKDFFGYLDLFAKGC